MTGENQKLVLAILEFLEKSISDSSVREDDKKGMEAASKSFVWLRMPPHIGARLGHIYGDCGSLKTEASNSSQHL